MISKPIATMKNLFKNLMLVAVAAMAFTACTETNDEVNAVVNKTRYEFTANIAEDTRSGFAEKEEGATAYKSEWFGNETLKIFVTDYNTYNVETTASINAEGQFTLELENAPESFFITAVSPAESWVSEYTATIPAVQTPLANSVDPKAHLLQAQAKPVSGNSGNIEFTHMAAYGKMTVNGVAFAIDHVVVDLKGTFYGYDRELSYTINATNVENNTFWFATEPIDVAEFTVTAYDAEGNSVTKTVDVPATGKTMSFQYGRVGTFSVKDLEAVVAPEEPVFTSASSDASTYDYVDCYLTFEGENLGKLVLNAYYVVNDKLELPVGSYMLIEAPENFWTAGYSYFIPAGTETTYNITSGTVKVSVVNNEYVIEFIDLVYGSNVLNTTYTGTIAGLNLADPRQELPAPSNVKATVSGKTITLTWDSVEGADGYRVKLFYPYDEYFEEVVTTNEYVYEAQLSNTNYSFTIMSYASDTNAQYRSSGDEYAYATTEDIDPKMELSESKLSFSADGGEKTFTVTLKNTDAAIEYTQEGDWFSVVLSGDTFTVNASANESETDAREGKITVTAGELSKTIDVTQSKKAAEGDGALNDINRFQLVPYGSDEMEVHLYLDTGTMNKIVLDCKVSNSTLATGVYSWGDGTILTKYSYINGLTGVFISSATLNVTNNGDGTYKFVGEVVSTVQKTYHINISGTSASE